MRGMLACLGVVGCSAALLLANPTREDKPAGPPVKDQEAAAYATQLTEIGRFISQQYYLEISETDLIVAGLRGLHEAAGVAAPPRLSASSGPNTPATQAATYSPTLCPSTAPGSIPHDRHNSASAYSSANSAG